MEFVNACLSNDYKNVKRLLKNGINPNDKMYHKYCLLLYTYSHTYTKITKILLKYGSNPNIQNNCGNSLLHDVVFYCDVEMVKILLNNDKFVINTNVRNNHDNTPIYYAFVRYNIEIIKLLISYDKCVLNINNCNCSGFNPLLHVSGSGCIEIVELLLNFGADPNIKDIYGLTPLLKAYEKFDIDCMKLLLKHKVNPNIILNGKYTLLSLVTSRDQPTIVKLLLENKAELYLDNNDNSNVLNVALRCEMSQSSQIILNYIKSQDDIERIKREYYTLLFIFTKCYRKHFLPNELLLMIKNISISMKLAW